MARRDIYVVERWDGVVVTPAIQPASKAGADQVFWTNLTSGDIVVFVVEGVFTAVGPPGAPNHVSKTIASGGTDSLTVHSGAVAGTHVAYGVYCKSPNRFAVGNSDPEIIIT